MDVLDEAHRRKALPYCKRGYNHYTWRKIRRRSHRHIVEGSPQAVSTSKKGKFDGTIVNAVIARIITRTEHFVAYLSNVMDVLDKNK
jgi:hypothetical protein